MDVPDPMGLGILIAGLSAFAWRLGYSRSGIAGVVFGILLATFAAYTAAGR